MEYIVTFYKTFKVNAEKEIIAELLAREKLQDSNDLGERFEVKITKVKI